MNIRIFFSSPGDVKMERETAKRIVDRLQSEIGERATIQPYFWEHEVMVATKDYQENIPHMDDFDIVVCILWSRLGTPLDPERHPKPGGGGFKSGTEYEFFTAMQAHELRGTPDIFVFKNMTEPRRPSRPKEVREAVDKEIDRLDSFFESYFEDEEFFTRAINIYSTLGEFEEKLTIALRAYITGRIPVSETERAGRKKPVYERQPYLGLASFDYEDAPVFFGRTAQVGEIITIFQTQELEAQSNTDAAPKHFTLVLGSSGSGKSSLARAGVLPMLTNPGVIEGANSWRTAIFKPGDQPGDPILALVNSLNTPRGLPELFADGTSAKELADLIRTQPQGGGLLLRQALTQAGAQALSVQKLDLEEKVELLEAENREEDARMLRAKAEGLSPPAVRIALLADQLEELFTSDLSPETLGSFIGILVALANSGRVFLMATLRSDFYPKCLEHPALVALMQGNGTYALPAPSAADIGQMIRQPAAIAGLSFEENTSTGESLDELLRDAALKDPAALPLLSYTLEQLHESRSAEGLMTLEAYHELGGLEGAIGSRAETVFTNLPGEAQAAFDVLCKQLVTLQEGGEPTRRRAFYSTLTRTPESKTLVDALVAARLLTADQSSTGERVIAVAHEALLRHWPRLVAWVAENRLFLNRRTRVASRMADWVEKEKSDEYLIPRGPNLSAAEGILAGHLASLDPVEIEFIARSAEKVRREDQRHLRNARLITAGALVLCLLALAGGLFAVAAKRTAQENEVKAEISAKEANQAKRMALSSEARASYTLGVERLEAGNNRGGLTSLAQTLAIAPDHKGALSRTYSELLYSLPRPIPIRSVTASSQMRQRISGCYMGSNEYVTYIAADKSPEVFDLKTMSVVEGPWTEEKKTVAPALTYKGDILLDIQEDGEDYSFRCWNIVTKKAGAVMKIRPKEFLSMLVTVDGKYFITALSDGSVNFISTETGKNERTWKQEGNSAWVTEIPGKYVVATFEKEIGIFNMETEELKRIPMTEGFSYSDGRPGLDSEIFCVQSVKWVEDKITNRFTFYDAGTGEPVEGSRILDISDYVADFRPNLTGTSLGVALVGKGPRVYDAFSEDKDRFFDDGFSATKVQFSHDGRHFFAATEEGTVNILDLKTMAPAFSAIHTDGKLEDMLVAWKGRYLLTASGTVATIWDLSVGTGLSQPMDLPGTAVAVSMGDGELRVQTTTAVQRFDTVKLARDPVATTFSYVAPLVSASMNRTASLLGDGKVSFLKSNPGEEKETPLGEWQCPAKSVEAWTFSEDGSLFITTTGKTCWVVDTDTSKVKAEFTLPEPTGYYLFVSRDKRFVVNLWKMDAFGYEFGLHVWDLKEGKKAEFGFADKARSQLRQPYVAISRDSRHLAIATANTGGGSTSATFLWDLQDPGMLAKEFVNPGITRQMEFSPDGSFLAIGSHNNGVQVRSSNTGEPLAVTIVPGGMRLNAFAISPDSSRLAICVTRKMTDKVLESGESASETKVWDWREALPVSRAFDLPTTASHLSFSKDGRSLFAVYPRKGLVEQSAVQAWETEPPPETVPLLFPLVQAAVAYTVVPGILPEGTNPFFLWETARMLQRGSWFFQAPEDRTVSPAFATDSMRWIKDNLVEIDNLLGAMPCVALSNAAIAHWRQAFLNNLIEELAKIPSDTPEYEENSAKTEDLADTIDRLRIVPERNPDAHPLIPYYLALQARSEKNEYRLKKYALLAYKRNPDDIECAELAAKIYEDAGHYKTALPILRKARELAPDNDDFRFRLGTALWVLDKKTEAQTEFAKAIESGQLKGFQKGIMLIYLGRGNEALAVFQKIVDDQKASLKADGYDLASLLYLVTAHLGAGDKETASSFFDQLVAAAPPIADAEIIRNAKFHPLLTESLLAALELHKSKHPVLAPKADE